MRIVRFRNPMLKKILFVALYFLGIVVAGFLVGAAPQPKPYSPRIDPASDQWKEEQKRIQVPAGFKVDLWAAEPLLANPVCFAIDEKNRFYVAEDFRLHAGVTDIRSHMDWLDDDLACRTVEDRTAMLKRKLGDKVKEYGVEHDRIRLIEDTTGAGKADKATVWADGFHDIPDGIGAGLVTRNGDVWYTCIPDLWKLRDTAGIGKADESRDDCTTASASTSASSATTCTACVSAPTASSTSASATAASTSRTPRSRSSCPIPVP